jgi:hypothetical protein
MLAVKGYFNGKEFIPLEQVSIKQNQKVIITVLDEFVTPEEPKVKPFKKYVGTLSDENFKEIEEALKDFEKVDANEW